VPISTIARRPYFDFVNSGRTQRPSVVVPLHFQTETFAW
jgi:hypothetical protein